jgi:EmrB/QacA subfamily drug resistance transporter
MPSTLSILVQVFTDPRARAQAIGIWAAVAGAAVAIGPILGGFLLEVTSWHAIFWVNPPLVVLAVVATLLLVPESLDPSKPRLDPLGAVLSTVGIVAFVVTVIEVPDQGISTVTILSTVTAIVFLVAFVWWERRAPRPLLPMELFANRLFTVAIITVAIVYGALMGVMFFLPQFLQLVQGDSPLQSGIAMLPAAGGLFLASLFSPRWAERWGTRRIVVLGLVLVVVGLSLAAYLTAGSAYVHVGGSLGLMGLGLGMVLPQATNAVLASVPRERAGMGSAVNDGVGELGGSLGVAILGSLLSLGYRNEIEAQIQAAGDAINTIPAGVVDAVRESLAAGSLAVARLPSDFATPIREAAGNAFVSGMTTALMVAAVIVAAGAFLAWRMFPARVDKVEE